MELDSFFQIIILIDKLLPVGSKKAQWHNLSFFKIRKLIPFSYEFCWVEISDLSHVSFLLLLFPPSAEIILTGKFWAPFLFLGEGDLAIPSIWITILLEIVICMLIINGRLDHSMLVAKRQTEEPEEKF